MKGLLIDFGCVLTTNVFDSFKEFSRATGLYQDWWMTGIGYLGIVAGTVLALVPDPNYHAAGWFGLEWLRQVLRQRRGLYQHYFAARFSHVESAYLTI